MFTHFLYTMSVYTMSVHMFISDVWFVSIEYELESKQEGNKINKHLADADKFSVCWRDAWS